MVVKFRQDQPGFLKNLPSFANCSTELSITYNLIDLDSIHNKLSSDYRLNMFLTPFSLRVFHILMVNRFFNTNGLLTGCEGHTEKYRTAVFVQPELARHVLKDQVPVFLSMA